MITKMSFSGVWVRTDVAIYRDYLQRRDGRFLVSRLRQRLQPPASTKVSATTARFYASYGILEKAQEGKYSFQTSRYD